MKFVSSRIELKSPQLAGHYVTDSDAMASDIKNFELLLYIPVSLSLSLSLSLSRDYEDHLRAVAPIFVLVLDQ